MDLCMIKPTPENKRFAADVLKMHLLTFTIGLVLIGIVGYGFYSGDRINTVDASLVRSSMKIKLEASTTNLLIEGLLGEGLATGFEPVWAPMEIVTTAMMLMMRCWNQRIFRWRS